MAFTLGWGIACQPQLLAIVRGYLKYPEMPMRKARQLYSLFTLSKLFSKSMKQQSCSKMIPRVLMCSLQEDPQKN